MQFFQQSYVQQTRAEMPFLRSKEHPTVRGCAGQKPKPGKDKH